MIARLDPQDVFGVVTFDDQAEVAVPAAHCPTNSRPLNSSTRSSLAG